MTVLKILSALLMIGATAFYQAVSASDIPAVYHFKTNTQDVTVTVILGYEATQPGLAHYVEHLTWSNIFDGVERRVDADTNAWASDQAIGYWLSGDANDLTNILKTLSGVFKPLALDEAFAAEERTIILREYEFSFSGNLDAVADEALNLWLYEGNAIATSVIGMPEEIRALDYQQARDMHAVTHTPDEVVLVITGDVSERQVRRALKKAGWPQALDSTVNLTRPLFRLAEPTEKVMHFKDEQVKPRLLWRRVVALPESFVYERLTMHTELLSDILVSNLEGGFAGPLRYNAFIARNFDIHVVPIDERHIEMRIQAEPDQGVSLTQLQFSLETLLADTALTGIPIDTFNRVLNRYMRLFPNWDDPDETVEWVASNALDTLAELRAPQSVTNLRLFAEDISLDRLNNLLNQLADKGRTGVAFLGPEEFFNP